MQQQQEKEKSVNNGMSSDELMALLDEKTNKLIRQVVELENGRQLSYSESGRTDGGGYPVLFQFGLMGSSLIIVLFHHIALELNLHLIAVDYPGIGDSTPQPNRSLRDWPPDILDFCRQVVFPKSDTFALCCHSMGGPHALAILNYPPLVSKISRVALICPWIMADNPAGQTVQQHDNKNNNSIGNNKSELGNTSSVNWIQQGLRFVPKFAQEHIIPPLVANVSTSAIVTSGSLAQVSTLSSTQSLDRRGDDDSHDNATSSKDEARLQAMAVQIMTRYASKQGQGGNQQMVKLAITEIPPFLSNNNNDSNQGKQQKEKYDIPIAIYRGSADSLVSEASCLHLLQRMKPHFSNIVYESLDGADHNNVMSDDNQRRIFKTLTPDFNNKDSGNSHNNNNAEG